MFFEPINNGYYNVKADNNLIFKSAYIEIDPKSDEYYSSKDMLEFNGKYYIVGDGMGDYDMDKTLTEANKIFILNVLVKRLELSKKTSGNFTLLLSAPPRSLKGQKIKLYDYLKGIYEVGYHDTKYTIIIEDVRVYPEAILAYIVNKPKFNFRNKVVVIDIGGCVTRC